jgi:hypothetical protein
MNKEKKIGALIDRLEDYSNKEQAVNINNLLDELANFSNVEQLPNWPCDALLEFATLTIVQRDWLEDFELDWEAATNV